MELANDARANEDQDTDRPAYSLIRIAADDLNTLSARWRQAMAELHSGSHHAHCATDGCRLRLAFVTTAQESRHLSPSPMPKELEGSVRTAIGRKLRIAFLFSGLDLDAVVRCHVFLRECPEYRDFLARADRLVTARLAQSLTAFLDKRKPAAGVLFRRLPSRTTTNAPDALAHVALITVECALAEIWRGLGIAPDAVVGYSLGEFSAACVAGAFDFETIISMVLERALEVEALPRTAMVAVAADYDEIKDQLAPNVYLVARNAKDQTILGGIAEELDTVCADLRSRGFVAEAAASEHAFHTPLMAPAAARIEASFSTIKARPLAIPMISTVTGAAADSSMLDESHWSRHLTSTVRFHEALRTLEALETDIFLEVGPGQALSALAQGRKASSPEIEVASSMPSSLDRRPAVAHFLRAAGQLWAAGAPLADKIQDFRADRWALADGASAPASSPDALVGTIQEICANALRLDRIEPTANLFDFGANSLKLVRIAQGLNNELGRQLTMRDILADPTPAGIAANIGDGRSAGSDQAHVTFPGGLGVYYQSASEARYLHRSIFEDRSYVRHGLEIRPGDTVFDVGANIGLFSIFCALEAPDVKLFAFEPVPELFSLLRCNANDYCDNITLFNEGLGDTDARLPILFYPNSPGMSSFAAAHDDEKYVLGTILENQAKLGEPELEELLANKNEYLEARLFGRSTESRVRRLSDVIAEEGPASIDFMKIDCQKYELKVLNGIDGGHWQLIKQAAVEVHDEDDRLRTISNLLTSRGFLVEIDQDELYKGTDIHLLYARRI